MKRFIADVLAGFLAALAAGGTLVWWLTSSGG